MVFKPFFLTCLGWGIKDKNGSVNYKQLIEKLIKAY